MGDRVRISVLIATHGRPALLERTLDSLSRAVASEWLNAVWVLENGSVGQARELCERFSSRLPLRYRSSERPGKTRAQQSVLPEVGDDLLLFLDDDVRVDPGILDAYGSAAAAAGGSHYFGGPINVDYEEVPPPWILPYLPLSAVGFIPFESKKASSGWEFLGANFAAFAADVRRVGGFDLERGPGAVRSGSEGNPLGDEAVLQQRLLRAGCRPLAVADALVWHWVPRERCSPAWVLHRAQRHAMTDVLGQDGPDRGALGVPPWLIRALAESVPGMIGSYATPDAERRFRRRLDFYRNVGRLQGFRLRRKRAASLVEGDARRR